MPNDRARAAGLRVEGRREEALDLLRRFLEKEPKSAAGHALLGEVLREMGGRRKGYAEIQQAVLLDPAGDFKPGETRFDAWAYGCRGGGRRSAGDLAGAEADLRRAVALDAGCGWAWGWLGEILLRQGKASEALDALTRAVALFAEWPEAFAWRGEAKRQAGDMKSALADLDHAVALGYTQWDVYLSRGTVKLALGDEKGYIAEMTKAIRAAPAVFKEQSKAADDPEGARWIAGILKNIEAGEALLSRAQKAAAGGKAAQAMALMEKSIKADPTNVKTYALRAKSFLDRGDLLNALKDSEEAVRLAPSADHYALRADVSQRLGYMESSLKDLSIAVALAPNSKLFLWRAQTFVGMRHYDLAIKETSAALEQEPDNPVLYELRAHINMLLGRLGESLEDVERALKIAPGQVNLHLRLGQALALLGRFDDALESVAPIAKKFPAWAAFIRGYVRCVAKDYDGALADFREAVEKAQERDASLKTQAVIYGTVAKAMQKKGAEIMQVKEKKAQAVANAKDKGKVYLCGLGVYPPQTATMEVLRAIGECDVIFNNLPGMGVSEFLGLFCAKRRPVAFRYEQDAKLCADLVLSEVKPGRTVAFVTFGHPLLFGPLSNEIIQRCRKDGIPCKAFGAVSSMDAVLAASGQVLGFSYGGFQLFESMGTGILDEIAKANPKLPLVIFFADGMSNEWLAGLAKILAKNYSKDYECLFYGPRHELWETQQEKLTVAELAKKSHHKLAQGILFVPPVEK